MSVHPPARLFVRNKLYSHWTSFHVIVYEYFFFLGNLLRKFKFNESLARITGTLHGALVSTVMNLRVTKMRGIS